MRRRVMRGVVSFLMLAISCCWSLELVEEFQLPKNIDPIAIKADGSGRYFILDSSGKLTAFEKDSLSAEIDPARKTAGWIEASDMDFASGWLYVADRSGSAIYITDRYLRSPAKVDLAIEGETVRPAKIAVSTDGRILIYDEDRAELLLYKDWRDTSPITLAGSFAPKSGRVELAFDFSRNAFLVISETSVIEYSILGAFSKITDSPSPDSEIRPITGGTVGDAFYLVDNRGVWRYFDGEWIFRLKANASASAISVRSRVIIIEDGTFKSFRISETR